MYLRVLLFLKFDYLWSTTWDTGHLLGASVYIPGRLPTADTCQASPKIEVLRCACLLHSFGLLLPSSQLSSFRRSLQCWYCFALSALSSFLTLYTPHTLLPVTLILCTTWKRECSKLQVHTDLLAPYVSGTHYNCPLVYPTGILNISCILFLVLHRSQVLPPPFFPLRLADHHVLLIVAFRKTNSFLSISPAHPPKHTTPPDVLSFNSFLYCTCNMPFKKSNNT